VYCLNGVYDFKMVWQEGSLVVLSRKHLRLFWN
jgi:hypothetical protein